jgi:hypothetical protein
MTASKAEEHTAHCAQPGISRRTNSVGQSWATCRGCEKTWPIVWTVEPTKVGPVGPVAPVVVQRAPVPISPYRCREHPARPVSWRGTGCPQCTAAKRKPPKAKTDPTERQYR